MPHVYFLSISPVLCDLVCFRWCAGDDSYSSSRSRAKESSKRSAQLDAEMTTEGSVCLFLCREEGISTRGMHLKWAWHDCVDSLTPAVFSCLCFCHYICTFVASPKGTECTVLLLTTSQLDFVFGEWHHDLIKQTKLLPVGALAAVVSLVQYLALWLYSSFIEKYIPTFSPHSAHSHCFDYWTRFMTEGREALA